MKFVFKRVVWNYRSIGFVILLVFCVCFGQLIASDIKSDGLEVQLGQNSTAPSTATRSKRDPQGYGDQMYAYSFAGPNGAVAQTQGGFVDGFNSANAGLQQNPYANSNYDVVYNPNANFNGNGNRRNGGRRRNGGGGGGGGGRRRQNGGGVGFDGSAEGFNGAFQGGGGGRKRNNNRGQNRNNGFLHGYSGFRPRGWGTGMYGERQKRISQIKFDEYSRRIYGNENYDENSDILSADDLNGRVIAAPGEFPHVAVIGIKTARGPNNTHWKCGGSLIDVFYVLTAAHCTDFGGEPPNWVKVGDVNLGVREDTVATQRFRIAHIYRHPEYKNSLNYHDIALIKLIKPAVFTKHVRPARLWAADEIPFQKVFALGYGATRFGKTPTNVLTFFNLTTISNTECNTKFPKTVETPNGILENQICAADYEQNRDTCQGDSGGPLELILPGKRRARYYIIGVTSFGAICGSAEPSVYTKVYSYLDWIEQVVWQDSLQTAQQQQQLLLQQQQQQLFLPQQQQQQQYGYDYYNG